MEASREIHGGRVSAPWVAAHVSKNDGSHPCRQSLHDFFRTVDSDVDWFSGKHRGKRRDATSQFTPQNRNRCALAMMRLKHHASETPSVEQMKRLCPRAVQNPKVGSLSMTRSHARFSQRTAMIWIRSTHGAFNRGFASASCQALRRHTSRPCALCYWGRTLRVAHPAGIFRMWCGWVPAPRSCLAARRSG